jgi:transposase, IS5 family
MKNVNPLSLFDDYWAMEKLTKLGDPLYRLDQFIDWRVFESTLNQALENKTKNPSKGGRPPFPKLLLFKALVIQSLYNLSDEQLEYQILDRSSFKRFLGLKKSDKVPDSRTFWLFREQLVKNEITKELFVAFNAMLDNAGIFAKEGTMVDASFVNVPKQRNSREENKHIKETGEAPGEWKENPHKLSQKDIDASWTKKNEVNFFGFKNHVKADQKTKLIEDYAVSDAACHDSQAVELLLSEQDRGRELHADSAYTGEELEELYKKYGIEAKINEKGYRNKPLTAEQKENNKEKSKVRARVEHVFGFMENSMNGSFIRTIGIARAKVKIGLMNIVYNMCRCVQLKISVSMG